MNLSPTTIVLWQSEADPHTIRLRSTTTLSDYWAAATVRLSSTASLLAGARFAAAPTVSIASTPRLNVLSRFAAAPALSLASRAPPTILAAFRAASSVSVQTTAPLLVVPTLTSRSTVTLGVSAATITAPVRFRAASSLALSVGATLSRVAQFFAAASTIPIRTTSNLVLVGKGATDVLVTFNGVESLHVRVNSIQITDALNEAPNTAMFVVNSTPPAIGTDVRIGLQNTLAENLLFAGTVKSTEQYYEGKPANPAWSVRCDDYTFLINRRRVVGTWTNVSASQVATEIVQRFTAGFSTGGIAGGLPAITVTFTGETVMDALTQVANLAGAYAGGPDYNRTVWLFVTDPRPAPLPVVATSPLLMMQSPVTRTLDATQTRTRVIVQGASVSVSGPDDTLIDTSFGQIPLAESTIFAPGESGQVLTDDAQVVNYSDVIPGQLATTVRGNVPSPTSAPLAQIATGKAGGLDGTYFWKVAFANQYGETPVGPPTAPPLTVSAFPTPPAILAPGQTFSSLGPLVGTYQYAVTFVTALGETLPSGRASFTATAVAPPASLSVVTASGAGKLLPGQIYRYRCAYLTTYGESLWYGDAVFQPAALEQASLSNFTQYAFGGLAENADYYYAVSVVTTAGESAPPVWSYVHTTSTSSPGSPGFTGYYDSGGRMAWGQYYWTCSYYHDTFGETPYGPSIYNTPSGQAPPAGTTQRIGISLPALGTRADGLRLYRAIAGGNPFQLEADFRRTAGVPSSYLSYLSQGECGNPWPNHQRRAGGIAMQLYVAPSSAANVIARRVYRTRANPSTYTDWYLLTEIQSNDGIYYVDVADDSTLSARAPVVQTAGRQALIALPMNPGVPSSVGFTGRRLYRSKANQTVYARLVDIPDMTTPTFTDGTGDDSLTGPPPPVASTAGGQLCFLQNIAIGPPGTLARRIYRTVSGGSELKLLTQISDNTTGTFTDGVPDAQLGATAPLVTTAGAAAVQLSLIPIGPAGVTQRLIYRTKATSPNNPAPDYFFVGSIPNNTDTTFLDDKADSALGRAPVPVSTIGALAGDTSVVVASAAGWPTAGWFAADSQVIRYTGISYGQFNQGDTLTGIPPLLTVSSLGRSGQTAVATTVAAHGFRVGQRIVVLGADQPEYTGTRTLTAIPGGAQFSYLVSGAPASPATGQKILTSAPGAISAGIAGGTAVVSVAMLVGVSGLNVPIKVGSNVALWVVCNSAAGQAALAALEGGDGIHEYLITDGTLKSVTDCRNRGQAELLLFQDVQVAIDYVTRDKLTRSGAMVSITLGAPTNISGSFRIQEVRIDQVDIAGRTYPRYTVHCSTTKFSLMDLLRHAVLRQNPAA